MNVPQRMAGLLLPLFSLRRPHDAGIGDLLALEDWIRWAAQFQVKFLQLLPVNALGIADAPSPYSAISSVALEPLYLSLERVPGLQFSPDDLPPQDLPPRILPGGEDLVDYRRVRDLKMRLFREAWKKFHTGAEDSLQEEFQAWVAAEGRWLDDFACYQVASTQFGTHSWWLWPLQDPDLLRNHIDADPLCRELKQYQMWLQWLCHREWREVRELADELGVQLMGDVPIGISVASADVFFERHQFDMQWSGGAPAEGNFAEDPFTAKWGQNWGIPLYRWDVMKQDGFQWWSRRIRKMAEIFGMYRVDHILGFYRIYAFPWMPDRNEEFLPLSPDEAAARCEGRRPGFRPHPDWSEPDRKANLMQGDELLRHIMRLSQGLTVIGEDLGCVPDYVRPNLSQLRIAGFKIPHWEVDAQQKIVSGATYNVCSFACYATHDFAPISHDWNEWYGHVHRAQELRERFREAASALSFQPKPEQAANYAEKQRIGKDCRRVLNLLTDYCGREEDSLLRPWDAEIKDALFRALMACNSAYVAMMWTELFDFPVRLNSPGTEGGSNWRARIPLTAIEAAQHPGSGWIRDLIVEAHR